MGIIGLFWFIFKKQYEFLRSIIAVGKGRFISESEIDFSNCQTHMPNHYIKVEILKLSSITVKCCISVSVLNFNQPIMFICFGY